MTARRARPAIDGAAAARLWKLGAMVERYAHIAPEGLQAVANRLDSFGGHVAATAKEKRASPK